MDGLEQRQLTHGGHTLHYAIGGHADGPLAVLIHPAFSDHTSFAPQVAALGAELRLALIDMPGHGRAQGGAAQVADLGALVGELIRREGRGPAHLLGVSLGSLVAQAVAATHGAASLTVVGGYPIAGTSPAVQRAQAGELLKILALLAIAPARFRRYVARQSTATAAGAELFERSAAQFRLASLRAMAGTERLMRPEPRSLGVPLLIVLGEHERPLLRQEAERWQRYEPHSRLEIVAGAGHCVNLDAPAQLNELALGWMLAAAPAHAAGAR